MTDSVLEKFLNKIQYTSNDECWPWQAYKMKSGYGQFHIGKKTLKAHRLAWGLVNGNIPDGMVIMHKCDSPSCVNPNHLVCGTQKENNMDKSKKNRHHNQKKTHCPRGHEYSAENTRYHDGGRRICCSCFRSYSRSYYKKIKHGTILKKEEVEKFNLNQKGL